MLRLKVIIYVWNSLHQILSFKNLMKKNRERVAKLGAPSQNSAINLPFLVVNTSKKTTIDCSISSDKYVMGISCVCMYTISSYAQH